MAQSKSKKPNWEYFDDRLNSLVKNKDILQAIEPPILAHAGFHYENGEIICHECGLSLVNLYNIYEPNFDHVYSSIHKSPSCFYLRRSTGTFLPHTSTLHKFTSETCDMIEHGPHKFGRVVCFSNPPSYNYHVYMNRFTSFSNVVDLPFSPLILAHIGFCYDDKVRKIRCYECAYDLPFNLSLERILELHMSRSCEYMRYIFGSDVMNLKYFKCLI